MAVGPERMPHGDGTPDMSSASRPETIARPDADGEVAHEATARSAGLLAGVALAGASAIMAVIAFPPFDLWPLIFVAFVPMIVAQHRVLPPRLAGLALGIGVGGLFAGQFYPGMAEAGLSWGYKAMPAYLAVAVAVGALGSRGFQERTGYRWFLVSGPIVWVAVDFVRGTGSELLGGTWGNPAYALYAQYRFLQPISIFGIYGLQLLILVVNWALAFLLLVAIDARFPRAGLRPAFQLSRPAAWGLGGVALALASWGLASLALLDTAPATLRVAAIQPGLVDPEEELRRDMEQTRAAASQGAQLVVWRENGLRFDPRVERSDALRSLAAESGAHLAIGYGLLADRGRVNEATVLEPGGRFLGAYGKDHPGEFAGDFSDTGGGYPVYDTPFGKLATIICYDLDFTDTAREMVRRGAQVIAVPSSDNAAIAATHYTHLVFRAIENRIPLVKADRAFDSAIIDPWGRILESSVAPGGARATLVADVPIGSGQSLATVLGDWVGWICVATALGLLTTSVRTRIRERRAVHPHADAG